MKRFLYHLMALLLLTVLTGCESNKHVLSSAGTIGPVINQTIPLDQHFLTLAVLRDTNVDIVSENIFIYRKLGSTQIPAALINGQLNKTMATTLHGIGYHHVRSNAINTPNVLNTTDIQLLTNHSVTEITPEARQFLAEQIKDRNIDIIILITQNGHDPLAFDLKCELSKNNFYYHASIQPHLDLYKIYVINAHTMRILTWITGSANGDLSDTSLCKPINKYSPQDFNTVNNIVISGLNKSVSTDLFNTLTPDPRTIHDPKHQL